MTNASPLMEVTGVTKHFGSNVAVDDVSFDISSGKLHSLIGPNGAGKTTLFNCITGDLTPTSGSILFAGTDVTGYPSYKVAQEGISRSYQVTNLFNEFTTFENLRLASQVQMVSGMALTKPYTSFEQPIDRASELIEFIGLQDERDTAVSNLSHGQKRLLELGVTLAPDPELMLLDEPMAGVSSEEIDAIVDLISKIGSDRTILLIEHNIDVVMDVSDKILVLNQGELLSEGDPADIRDDENVQRAYLGTDGETETWSK